jgi:hypothetical protein
VLGSLRFVVLKIPKGTQWEYIIGTVSKNINVLYGIDKFAEGCLGAEWVSHVFEMARVQLQNNGYIYLPIPDEVRRLKIGHEPRFYGGKLHDGLVFDPSSDSIVEKIEFKSKINRAFSEHNFNKFLEDYGPLGVDRLDLCCLNSQSFKQTVLNINQFDHHSVSPKLNAVDFSTVFTEPNNDSYSNNINEVLSNQIALKSELTDVLYHLLSSDPSFFPSII